MSDLPRDLRVKAGMIMMCERIPFGSDAALMEIAANEIEQLQQRNAELAAQVEQLRSAAQPIINDYFNWMEVNEVDISELTESYQKVYDMMVNLNCKLKSTPTQHLADHDRKVAAIAVEAAIKYNDDCNSGMDYGASHGEFYIHKFLEKIKSVEVSL